MWVISWAFCSIIAQSIFITLIKPIANCYFIAPNINVLPGESANNAIYYSDDDSGYLGGGGSPPVNIIQGGESNPNSEPPLNVISPWVAFPSQNQQPPVAQRQFPVMPPPMYGPSGNYYGGGYGGYGGGGYYGGYPSGYPGGQQPLPYPPLQNNAVQQPPPPQQQQPPAPPPPAPPPPPPPPPPSLQQKTSQGLQSGLQGGSNVAKGIGDGFKSFFGRR